MSAFRTLREVNTRQPPLERPRRWFSSEDFDLIVWFDDHGAITGFELCYDRSDIERALTWNPTRGYRHWRVDTGDATGMNPGMTPILEPDDAEFPKDRVIAAFAQAADAVDSTIRSFVVERLHEVRGEHRSHERACRDRLEGAQRPTPDSDAAAGSPRAVPRPPVVTEREWWNSEQPPAWRRALMSTAIAIILALAVWLFILWLMRK